MPSPFRRSGKPSTDQPDCLTTVGVDDDDESSGVRHPHENKAVFVVRVGRVGDRARQRITEGRGRLFERQAVLAAGFAAYFVVATCVVRLRAGGVGGDRPVG
jgi:hypothetical protein